MHKINVNQIRITQNQNKNQSKNFKNISNESVNFQILLQKEIQKNQNMKFSKHAIQRLEQRKIQLTKMK